MRQLILLPLLFVVINLNAQGLRFGIKAGADMNKMEAVGFDNGFTFGYHAGAFAEIKISKKVSLNPEVYFSQHNLDTAQRFSDIYPTLNSVSGVTLKYINIPLLLSYKLSKGIALQGGPQFGIMTSQNGLVRDGKDAFKTGDVSMVGGLQLNLGNFIIYGRYVVGLNDVQNIDVSDITDSGKWKNQTIHLGLGLALF